VFERVNQDVPLEGLHWFIDDAEAISPNNIDRIAALGGGIAVQHRMAYQSEYFVERYGRGAAHRHDAAKGRQGLGGADALRFGLRRPRPCPRDGVVGAAADRRPQELLGRARLRLLGRVGRWTG
jgi:hypothetical protein